jgi:hypothetical protein
MNGAGALGKALAGALLQQLRVRRNIGRPRRVSTGRFLQAQQS